MSNHRDGASAGSALLGAVSLAVPARRYLGCVPAAQRADEHGPLRPGQTRRAETQGFAGFLSSFPPRVIYICPCFHLRSSKTSAKLVPSLPAAREKLSGLSCPCELWPWFALVGWPEPSECRGKAGPAPAPPAGWLETPRALPCVPAAGGSITLRDARWRRGPPLPTPWVPGVSHSTCLPRGSHLLSPFAPFPPPAPAPERQNSA